MLNKFTYIQAGKTLVFEKVGGECTVETTVAGKSVEMKPFESSADAMAYLISQIPSTTKAGANTCTKVIKKVRG